MRKKIKGKLYYLARDAKKRMCNYNHKKSVFNQLPYGKLTFNEHDQELYERVKKLLSRDEIVINPIQELMNKKYYDSLSLDGKQKYISDLSEKYKELKLRIEHEQEEFANVSNI